MVSEIAVSRLHEIAGQTPLVRLKHAGDPRRAPIYVKMESYNPSGSVRDRHVQQTVLRAIDAGQVEPGDTVVIAGIHDAAVSVAFHANVFGLNAVVIASTRATRRLVPMIERYGAVIEWIDAEGLEDVTAHAARWARDSADRWYFDARRRDTVETIYAEIAQEILAALPGHALGGFVTSVTTGATFRHVARRLRESHPELVVQGVKLAENLMASQPLNAHVHEVPLHDIWPLRDQIAREEGVLLSPKGVAAVRTAIELQAELAVQHPIVALNPDSGHRYLGWEAMSLYAN